MEGTVVRKLVCTSSLVVWKITLINNVDITLKDIYGKVLDEYYPFEDTTIHDVAVTPDSARMICVATRIPHADYNDDGVASGASPVPVDRKEEMILGECLSITTYFMAF